MKKSVYGINRELRGRRYQSSSPQRSIVEKRRLENGTDIAAGQSSDQGLGKHEDEDDDLPSCNDVLLHETIEERCHHAKNCDGEYLMRTLLPLAFCNYPSTQSPLDDHPMLRTFFPVLFPVSLLVMTLLLFRLLGSTAENYFSPALEMISSEFQIVSLQPSPFLLLQLSLECLLPYALCFYTFAQPPPLAGVSSKMCCSPIARTSSVSLKHISALFSGNAASPR